MKGLDTPRTITEGAIHCCFAVFSWLVAGTAVVFIGYLVWRGYGPLATGLMEVSSGQGGGLLLLAWLRTLQVLLVSSLLAFPLGVATGTYLSEYAPKTRLAGNIKDAIASLANIPPIIYGLFGWGALTLYWGVDELIAVMLTSASWLLPSVVTVTYASMQEVPMSFRRESLALGASPWQTTYKAVLPYARRNIIAGVLEGMARLSGMAAPIIIVAASLPDPGRERLETLPYHLYRSVADSPQVGIEEQFAAALLLLITSLLLQSVPVLLRTTQSGPIAESARGKR